MSVWAPVQPFKILTFILTEVMEHDYVASEQIYAVAMILFDQNRCMQTVIFWSFQFPISFCAANSLLCFKEIVSGKFLRSSVTFWHYWIDSNVFFLYLHA